MAERWLVRSGPVKAPGTCGEDRDVREATTLAGSRDAVAHDAGGGPGGGPSRGPGDARAGRRRTAPARVRRARRQGSPAGRRPEEGQAPDLAADLRRELRRQGLRQVRRPAGQPLGRQQHRDLQLADPRQQPRTGLVLHQLRGLLDRRVRLLPARPGLQRRRRAGATGPSHEDRDAADAAAAGLGRQRGVVRRQPPVQLPRVVQPAGRPRPVPLDLRQRAAQRAVADRRPDHGRRGGRAGVLGAVDRRAQGEVRRRASTAASRSTSSATSRRSGTTPTTASTRSPRPTTSSGPSRATSRWRSRTPTRARRRSVRPSGAGPTTSARPPTTSTRAASRPRRTAPRTAAPTCRRGTCSSSRPTSSRPAAGCSTTSTCTTTRRASTRPSPT